MWAMVGAVTGILHATLLSWTQSAGLRFGREEWVGPGRLFSTWNSRWPWLLLGALIAVTWLVLQPHTPAGSLLGLATGWWPILLGAFVNLWLAAETQTLLGIHRRILRAGVGAAGCDWPRRGLPCRALDAGRAHSARTRAGRLGRHWFHHLVRDVVERIPGRRVYNEFGLAGDRWCV